MVIHMKTTLNIDDTLLKRLRVEATRRGTTMSALVEAGLRGNLFHDLHTAVAMRENGVSRICTRDTDFHRFPLRHFDRSRAQHGGVEKPPCQ